VVVGNPEGLGGVGVEASVHQLDEVGQALRAGAAQVGQQEPLQRLELGQLLGLEEPAFVVGAHRHHEVAAAAEVGVDEVGGLANRQALGELGHRVVVDAEAEESDAGHHGDDAHDRQHRPRAANREVGVAIEQPLDAGAGGDAPS